MNKLAYLLMAILFSAASLVHAAACPTANQATEPQLLQWTHHPAANGTEEYWSGVLEMGEASFIVNGETLTTRAYRQEGGQYSIPGPTVVMVPGKKYVLTFRNLLPYEAPAAVHNDFKDPNISNLHTHGVHISPENPSDEVTRVIEGGFAGDYVYDIGADHMGGTFWYHAHHHGSTYLQAAGGAFGLMIISDELDQIPATVRNMTEQHVVLGYLDPNARGIGGDTLISGTLGPTWTVNGTVNGDLCIPPNTWQHWRVLVANRDGKLRDLTVGDQCEVALMARDGVWRTVVPKALTGNTIGLTGASRADLAIRCSANSTVSIGNVTVANINVDTTAATDTSVHPYDGVEGKTWASVRPPYLRDLRTKPVARLETINMGARTINGNKFDINVPLFELATNGVQEWGIQGAQNHPFHLHVYHFQVQRDCGDFEAGEYYDTLAANCDVRFDLTAETAFRGKTIMHCHILDHEDQGAMTYANVLGGAEPPTFPADPNRSFAIRYPIASAPATPPIAPTQLNAQASGTSIALTWLDNSNDETGFNIERSLDGTNFAVLTTVNANTMAYTDTGLSANTTYSYRVNASNDAGNSAYTNVAGATTQDAPTVTSMQVGSVTLTTTNAGGGNKVGTATVVILDNLGNPVANAIVTGDFTGDITEAGASGPATDTAGSTVINTTGTARGGVTLQFCVTSVTHPTLPTFTAEPGLHCGNI
ncbi:MAG: multicopper oxidase domain-containing protein [Gammaproteobacteria bacterium]|nr:multicopper oxidase domain-containing protein [Gammaproteobacteria bacterium]